MFITETCGVRHDDRGGLSEIELTEEVGNEDGKRKQLKS